MKTEACLAALALLSIAAPKPAHACGGLFCNGSAPVLQTGEKIIFTVDHDERIVHAIINVAYQGPANEFAWILPLQSAPAEIKVAPTSIFTTVDAFTAPRFPVTVEQRGVCADDIQIFPGAQDALAGSAKDSPQPGVDVIFQDEVGPYETVVIASSDVEELRTWLIEHQFYVTDEMIQIARPYVEKGDVLLALKLRKGSDVGDIQPIAVTMSGVEVCVPIRLTAVAALADMDITAVVLSDEGRAIPKNYFHVALNLARIDWTAGGQNYRALVGQAADEGSGNAFTTEFAGSARIFDDQIFRADLYDRAALERTASLRAFLEELFDQQLLNKQEMVGILDQYVPQDALGASSAQFLQCVQCFLGSVRDRAYDPFEAVEAIWARIVIPEQETQQLFDRYAYVTRLYTLISPEEMTLDPEFSFRDDLPDISNVHNAKVILDCGFGGERRSATVEIVIEETGQVIKYESNANAPDRTFLDQMPASTHVDQLEERRNVMDNTSLIEELLDKHNALASSCGCTSTRVPASGGLGGLALLVALLFARSRVRR